MGCDDEPLKCNFSTMGRNMRRGRLTEVSSRGDKENTRDLSEFLAHLLEVKRDGDLIGSWMSCAPSGMTALVSSGVCTRKER